MPTLAHPLPEPTNEPAAGPVLTLPHINSNLAGFCLPALHCVGLRRDLYEQRVNDPRWLQLYSSHEMLHWLLAKAGLFALTRLSIKHVYQALLVRCTGQEVALGRGGRVIVRPARILSVPLQANPEGEYLERWADIVRHLYLAAATVQEIFAVWGSLHHARAGRLLRPQALEATRAQWLNLYTDLPDFSRLYPAFERFANKLVRLIGFDRLESIAGLALETVAPTAALEHLIQPTSYHISRKRNNTRKVEFSLPTDLLMHKDNTSDLGLMTLIPAFNKLLWKPENPEDYRTELPEHPSIIIFDKHTISVLKSQATKVASGGDPEQESEIGTSKPQDASNKWYEDTDDIIWLESLFQQLTRAHGLQCPYWRTDTCCGRSAELEWLWKYTRARPTNDNWLPRGCLNEIPA